MPRLSRHETSLVIALFRDPAARESGPAQRLLQRLEHALSQSIDAVREQRRSKVCLCPDAKEETNARSRPGYGADRLSRRR